MTEPIDRQKNEHAAGCDGAGVFMVGALTFATGVLVGLATGMLVAPHSGAYTRRQLQNLAEDAKEGAFGLAADGLKVGHGTIVEATIIAAPSSTKNRPKARDPEMHQTKKGNQWYFGMKAPIGVDSRTTLIHSVTTTAANVHDSQVLPQLLLGQETRVWGDAAYSGQRDVIQHHAPQASCFIQTKAHRHRPLSEVEQARNRTKSKVRTKVEHALLVIKRIFGWAKVRYRGLEKNTHWLFISCGLANLYMARRRLMAVA